jgi:glucose/arabinose dehydrogenase
MSLRLLNISLICLAISLAFPLGQSLDIRADTQNSWPILTTELIASGYERPVHITHAGDNSARLFTIEQRGRIIAIEDGMPDRIFLDITDRVLSPFSGGGGEEGLLSLAFSPDFGFGIEHFYVYYTNTDGNNQVSRFLLSTDPDIAEPASEQIILVINHPDRPNHNGGQLFFGKDGYLYISTGDGGGQGDPLQNGQNPNTLLGKLLRIDVEAGTVPYGIPPTNPFVGLTDHKEEIWALGFRNPWRFSFDRLTGDLYLGDVGQSSWEEVNYQASNSKGGENYGWNVLEGFECFGSTTCDDLGMTYPIHVYPTREEGACAITGGYVYRGVDYPGLFGIYIYADYCSGKIWGLRDQDGMWINHLLLDTDSRISSFGEDESGNLYFADAFEGNIYMIQEMVDPQLQYLPIIY